MSVRDVQSAITFYSPCSLRMNRSEWTQGDHRKLASRERWRIWFSLKVHWKYIYTACFPLGHTHLDYQHFCVHVCVPKHAVRSACKTTGGDWVVLHSCGITGTYMWSLNPKFCCKKKKRENLYQNVIFGWKCQRWATFPGMMGAFKTWASSDVDIMYSSNFVMSSQKKKNVTSGVNKKYLCQMELNIYLWSTSIIWRRQLFCKSFKLCFGFSSSSIVSSWKAHIMCSLVQPPSVFLSSSHVAKF